MASIERDRRSNIFHIRFRFGGRAFRRSLGTSDPKRASARRARIEETLELLQSGRLSLPATCDPIKFILSDGKTTTATLPRLLTLGELVSQYQAARLPGVKEPSTERTEDLHLRHLERLLKAKSYAHTLSPTDLQSYVSQRLKEKRSGGALVAPATVRKEVATLRVVWNWARRQDLLQAAAPVTGLLFPKAPEKRPFMTWQQIEATLARGGISEQDQKRLWESLYLTRQEVHSIVEQVRLKGRCEAIYPMVLFAAHTGVRLSEAIRSQREDFDFVNGIVVVREKKRSRSHSQTHRRVQLTPILQEVLQTWLGTYPSVPHTFCKPPNLHRPELEATPVPFTKHMAREHLRLALKGSRWSNLRGFHVFRHSFASNLASQGVDQRIIDAWMGHQTEAMRQRYRHLAPTVMRDAITKLLPDEGGLANH